MTRVFLVDDSAFVRRALTRVLASAIDLAASMKDEYVATEHLLVALATVESGAQKVLLDVGRGR